MAIRANLLMKRNIDTLLRARGHQRKDLAMWCRKTESWISKIMNTDTREMPMKYYDRIADFFGLEVYQLFQPGITSLTERRKNLERRVIRERRVGRGGVTRAAPVSHQVALVELIGYLDEDEQAKFVRAIGDQLRGRLPRPSQGKAVAGLASDAGTPPPTERTEWTQRANERGGKHGGSAARHVSKK